MYDRIYCIPSHRKILDLRVPEDIIIKTLFIKGEN